MNSVDDIMVAMEVELMRGMRRLSSYDQKDKNTLASELEKFELLGTEDATFLERFTKSASSLDDLDSYYIVREERKRYGAGYGAKFPYIFFDAPFNFCLVKDGMALASVGFRLHDESITIEQLQGVQGREEILRRFRWPEALVNHVCSWAKSVGIPQVYMQGSVNNPYARGTFSLLLANGTYPQEFEMKDATRISVEQGKLLDYLIKKENMRDLKFLPHRAFIRYDVTARACGFDELNDGNYRKQV